MDASQISIIFFNILVYDTILLYFIHLLVCLSISYLYICLSTYLCIDIYLLLFPNHTLHPPTLRLWTYKVEIWTLSLSLSFKIQTQTQIQNFIDKNCSQRNSLQCQAYGEKSSSGKDRTKG